jgi:EAL domain-containing protein (putative c-di-GMP-specific phosphodiesterase class I)/DNA-binding response OmpR family regulator
MTQPQMNDKVFNILILDSFFYNKSIIQDMLETDRFNIRVTDREEDAVAALEDFTPDIIFCRMNSGPLPQEKLLCGFKQKADEKGVPFVTVSSNADIEFFLQGLKQGICHSILLPASAEYLTSRITDIVDSEHVKIRAGAPIEIEFSYRDKDYSISLTPAQLVQLIISLLNDSKNLSLTLSDTVKKKSRLEQRMRSHDVFGRIPHEPEIDIQMERDLHRALDNKEFQLYYQPIIELEEERMAGFEALLRWNRPMKEQVQPFDFISIVERLPLIMPLGFWIIEEAVGQFRTWEKKFSFNRPFKIGINISANQFIQPELSGRIASIVKNYGVNSENIAFEITESAFMTDMEAANLQLLQLKSNRHSIYMDDFGTGYSSLSYLQHFIVDYVKIDKSFVRWMHMDEQSEQIVRSLVGLAHNLRMKVVAEGIEEDQHMSMLRELKCDCGQGYYYSAPMDASSAEEYILNFYHKKRR